MVAALNLGSNLMMRHTGEGWLASGVVHVEAWRDRPNEQPHPDEEDLIAGAVETRRMEFMTARRCARAALGLLGYDNVGAIRSGRRREPLWPTGVVGSLTHCRGYRAAAIARASDFAAIGIDAERNVDLPTDVVSLIGRADELNRVRTLFPAHSGVAADRLLFSAKEAIYKAWYPLTGRWLDFLDAEVEFSPQQNSFTPRVLADVPDPTTARLLCDLRGSFTLVGNTLITAVVIPQSGVSN